MKPDTAEELVFAAQSMGLDAEVRDDYSGRGMYGETTAALVVDWSPGTLAAIAAQAAIDSVSPGNLIEDLRNARTDQMGRREIVIY